MTYAFWTVVLIMVAIIAFAIIGLQIEVKELEADAHDPYNQ
jgi:uncharacterized protein YneF (UPF0154 family)